MTDLVPTDTSEFRAQGFGDWSRMDGNSNSAHDHTSGAMTVPMAISATNSSVAVCHGVIRS
jgi:hypothetical protein